MTSRLRKTHLSKTLHFPTSVSSTPNAHSKNRVSSRLQQMLFFWKNDVSPRPDVIYNNTSIKHVFFTQKTNQKISKTHHLKKVFARGWGVVVNYSFARFTGQNYQTSNLQQHLTLELAAVISGPKK